MLGGEIDEAVKGKAWSTGNEISVWACRQRGSRVEGSEQIAFLRVATLPRYSASPLNSTRCQIEVGTVEESLH